MEQKHDSLVVLGCHDLRLAHHAVTEVMGHLGGQPDLCGVTYEVSKEGVVIVFNHGVGESMRAFHEARLHVRGFLYRTFGFMCLSTDGVYS